MKLKDFSSVFWAMFTSRISYLSPFNFKMHSCYSILLYCVCRSEEQTITAYAPILRLLLHYIPVEASEIIGRGVTSSLNYAISITDEQLPIELLLNPG